VLRCEWGRIRRKKEDSMLLGQVLKSAAALNRYLLRSPAIFAIGLGLSLLEERNNNAVWFRPFPRSTMHRARSVDFTGCSHPRNMYFPENTLRITSRHARANLLDEHLLLQRSADRLHFVMSVAQVCCGGNSVSTADTSKMCGRESLSRGISLLNTPPLPPTRTHT